MSGLIVIWVWTSCFVYYYKSFDGGNISVALRPYERRFVDVVPRQSEKDGQMICLGQDTGDLLVGRYNSWPRFPKATV